MDDFLLCGEIGSDWGGGKELLCKRCEQYFGVWGCGLF